MPITRLKKALKQVLRDTPVGQDDCHESYSQQGEDMVLRCLLQQTHTGFYVDVGAHHPTRYSNTYYFHKLGWRGINIDATPGSMSPFVDARPNDVNIEAAIARSESLMTYYLFNEPALNGFSPRLVEVHEASGRFRLIDRIELRTRRLDEVLLAHLPKGQKIDFLTVDVEGFDVEVLDSNDWGRYRPTLVVAEDTNALRLPQVINSPLVSFMASKGYSCCAKTMHTLLFVDDAMVAANGMEIRSAVE